MSSGIEVRARLRCGFDFAELPTVLEVWQQRARSRRLLAALPDEALKDIGLSRADAVGESRKPFWRE